MFDDERCSAEDIGSNLGGPCTCSRCAPKDAAILEFQRDAFHDVSRQERARADRLSTEASSLRAEVEKLTNERDEARADAESAETRLLAVMDGTFSVGDGTAQKEIERLRAEVERLTRERDEAVRYHDSNEAEYKRLVEELTSERDSARIERDEAEREADRLRAQRNSARRTLDRIAEHMHCDPVDDADLVEAVRLLVKERDLARAECERMVVEADCLATALKSLRTVIATDARDWSLNQTDAWIWGVLWGWGPLDEVRDTDAMPEVAARHRWQDVTQERLRRMAQVVDHACTDEHALSHATATSKEGE